MLDITRAGMTQLTDSQGVKGDWIVTLDKEELFKLSKDYNVEQVFEIRDVIKKMMDYAHKEGANEANTLAKVRLDTVITQGDSKLDILKAENERLAVALQKHILGEEI